MRYAAVLLAACGLGGALAAQSGFTVVRGFSVEKAQAPPAGRKVSPDLPEGSSRYTPETHTQSIFVLDGLDTVRRVRIKDLPDRRWHQSGGMDGLEFTSEKYRLVPGRVRHWIGPIRVKNSFGSFQENLGIRREYPAGTRFDDVLKNKDGVIFEHRVRTKDEEGFWTSEVVYEDPDARPKGYAGVTVRCGSCHGEAGTGSYDAGLVPGGDGTLSDPLDWSLVGPDERPAAPRPARVSVLPASPGAVLGGRSLCPT